MRRVGAVKNGQSAASRRDQDEAVGRCHAPGPGGNIDGAGHGHITVWLNVDCRHLRLVVGNRIGPVVHHRNSHRENPVLPCSEFDWDIVIGEFYRYATV